MISRFPEAGIYNKSIAMFFEEHLAQIFNTQEVGNNKSYQKKAKPGRPTYFQLQITFY